MTRDEVLTKWRTEGDIMRRRGGLVDGAAICREFAQDLEALMASEDEALLTLSEAARRSGYSEDHLGKLIRDGRLRNAGRKGSPRIRASDLPRKPASKLVPAGPSLYDPVTDARALSDRQRKGAHHG